MLPVDAGSGGCIPLSPRPPASGLCHLPAGFAAFRRALPAHALVRSSPPAWARPCYPSPAGKYVPSIGHFILQQSPPPNGTLLGGSRKGSAAGSQALSQRRPIEQALLAARPLLAQPPLFRLAGLAIGNGLTNPATQVPGLDGLQQPASTRAAAVLAAPGAHCCMRASPTCWVSQLDRTACWLPLRVLQIVRMHGGPCWPCCGGPRPPTPPPTPPPPLCHRALSTLQPLPACPFLQVMSHADVAYYGGFIDPRQRLRAMAMQLETVQLIQAGKAWNGRTLRVVVTWPSGPAWQNVGVGQCTGVSSPLAHLVGLPAHTDRLSVPTQSEGRWAQAPAWQSSPRRPKSLPRCFTAFS